MMQHPQASLLGLPVELRLLILEFALLNSSMEVRHRKPKRIPRNKPDKAWAILQVNSQIRSEAYPVFFEHCHFRLFDGRTVELSEFVDLVGTQAVSRIKSLTIHSSGKCSMFGLGDEMYVSTFFLSSWLLS